MFRNIMRTYVEFSGMADNKIDIVITVITLLLTIIYAMFTALPKVTSGVFTKDYIHNKKANLIFFDNFHQMDLKIFPGV